MATLRRLSCGGLFTSLKIVSGRHSNPLSAYRIIVTRQNSTSASIREPSRSVIVRQMREEDKPQIQQFLYDQFFPQNIVTRLLKLQSPQDCQYSVDKELRDTTVNLSAVATDSSDLVGVVLSRVCQKDDLETRVPATWLSDKEMILRSFQDDFVYGSCLKSANIFETYNVDQFLALQKATVHVDYHGRGVLKVLLQEILRLSRKTGISYLVGISTSRPTLAVVKQLGFECVSVTPLREFVYNGNVMFPNCTEDACVVIKRV